MNTPLDNLRRKVIVKTGTGKVLGIGQIIGICDAPTYIIKREDGTQFSWRVDLCEVMHEEQDDG